MYERLFDSALSRLNAERAHQLGFAALRAGPHVPGLLALAGCHPASDPSAEVRAFGLTFPGPLGIAAGFDKNAVGIDALAATGFSFVEVGTVTGRPQPGNDKPRLFRLVEDRAIVNRMGFNNDGAAVVARRLATRRAGRHRDVVVGVNIGKTKAVPDAEAHDDYAVSARALAPHADYLVVNVSSPNTPGLRDLQAAARLRPVLDAVRAAADQSARRHVPLLVKIAPDLDDDQVAEIGRLAVDAGMDGIVAVNTTTRRDGLTTPAAEVEALGAGGLSGPPLAARARQVLGLLRQEVGELPLVSVGGVGSAAEVAARLEAGATLVQAYTAFIYEGPAWPSRVQRELRERRTGAAEQHG